MEPFRFIIRFTKEFCVPVQTLYIYIVLIFQSVGLQVDLGGKRSWHRKFTNEHNLYVQKVKPIPFPTPVYWKLIPYVLPTLYTN